MAMLIRSTGSPSSSLPGPVRWAGLLAVGVVVGLAVGFAVGLARPRTWTYGPYVPVDATTSPPRHDPS